MSAKTTEEALPEGRDIRPLASRPQGRRPLFLFAALLAGLGGALFATLEMRRAGISSPSVTAPPQASSGINASPPELAIPPFDPFEYPVGYPPGVVGDQPAPPVAVVRTVAAPARSLPQSGPYPPATQPWNQPEPANSPPPAPLPAYAYQAPPANLRVTAEAGGESDGKSRVRADFLRNPATTVPQGTVIQAVLETALDSTRPGFVRAIVARDIAGFDGSRVLIPRGSKLFGEYGSDVSLGQKRALVRWRRLTRPDGAIIDVDSPSADPLGRAGIKGKVNSHFFQRFSGAILQSVLDIGVGVATREASGNNNVVLALPNSVQTMQVQKPEDIKPTLKVRQGSSVSVMVERDLDFTPVED